MIRSQATLFPEIERTIEALGSESITDERQRTLQPLIDFIKGKISKGEEVRINFICTHNSRRSHLAQVWAQTMAYYFGVENVFCYSGGTESTALFPVVVQTLQHSGFAISTLSEGANPVYSIKYAENEHPLIGFSKKLEDDFNPHSKFAAVMTCDSAHEACPFVPGAETRIPITFEDPKVFDNTHQQAVKYTERSLQIASEMRYVFSSLKGR